MNPSLPPRLYTHINPNPINIITITRTRLPSPPVAVTAPVAATKPACRQLPVHLRRIPATVRCFRREQIHAVPHLLGPAVQRAYGRRHAFPVHEKESCLRAFLMLDCALTCPVCRMPAATSLEVDQRVLGKGSVSGSGLGTGTIFSSHVD